MADNKLAMKKATADREQPAKSNAVEKFEQSLQQNLNRLMNEMKKTLHETSSSASDDDSHEVGPPRFGHRRQDSLSDDSSSANLSEAKNGKTREVSSVSSVSSSLSARRPAPSRPQQTKPISRKSLQEVKAKPLGSYLKSAKAAPPPSEPDSQSEEEERRFVPRAPFLSHKVPSDAIRASVNAVSSQRKRSDTRPKALPPPKAKASPPKPSQVQRVASPSRSLKSSMLSLKRVDAEEASYRVRYDKLMMAHKSLQEKFEALVQKHQATLCMLQKFEKRNSLAETRISKPRLTREEVVQRPKQLSLRSTEKLSRRN